MATTVLGAVLLVFVIQLQIGVTQPLDIKSDADCRLTADLKRQINDVERNLKEEFSKTIKALKMELKRITECPKGWKRYRLSCYMINIRNLSWNDAAKECHNMSAHLAEIDTRGENDFIQNMTNENSSGDRRVWLGGTDKTNEATWIWNFSGSPLRFKHWMKGEPNNHGNIEDCMEMSVVNGEWNDIECSIHHVSVCEKDLWM
ncbi:perlucin-like protein [Ostrea edulis]|uniref:perlucin-like protein n=1 Tax=Ostrea edulis TaxID=37623 RepID=UPI0024AE9CFD|nr:perlucin-like protein [Ostrea edulis]